MTSLLRAELGRSLRTKSVLITLLISPVASSLLFGKELVRHPPNGAGVAAYFLVSMAAVGAISGALGTGTLIARERARGWVRQIRVSPLGEGRYLAAKLALAAILSFVSVVGVLGAGTLIQHAKFSTAGWLGAATALWLSILVFCAFGTALGYLFGEIGIVAPIVLSTWVLDLLGGLFWPTSTFPHWLRVIAPFTPTYHISEVAHRAEVGTAPAVTSILALLGFLVASLALLGWARRRDAAQR